MSKDDRTQNLWAPWRIDYITGVNEEGCIFCNRLALKNDRENLIIERRDHAFVIMNKYPYNNGHLMIAPKRHTSEILSLTEEEIVEMFRLVQLSTHALQGAMHPHGFNIGINMGRVAGAGVEDHIHIHVVPRWNGDTNFMPVIGSVKVISEHLESTYDKLKESFFSLSKGEKP